MQCCNIIRAEKCKLHPKWNNWQALVPNPDQKFFVKVTEPTKCLNEHCKEFQNKCAFYKISTTKLPET